jgi:hypothetical protein
MACPELVHQVLLAFALVLAVPAIAVAARLDVTLRNGLLSVTAQDAAWADVVTALERDAGFEVHVSIPLTGSVTTSIESAPPERALRQLFGPAADFVFVYGQDRLASPGSVLTEVWVLSPGTRGRAVAVAPPPRTDERDDAALLQAVPAAALTTALQASDRRRAIQVSAPKPSPASASRAHPKPSARW